MRGKGLEGRARSWGGEVDEGDGDGDEVGSGSGSGDVVVTA